jgi:hypothetical protein
MRGLNYTEKAVIYRKDRPTEMQIQGFLQRLAYLLEKSNY